MGAAGIVPGGKHFLLNEQETNRSVGYSPDGTTSIAYSAVADDKTLHETYLFPFYEAVKNGMAGVMCAMNRVNGTQSCENSELLNKMLKIEIGFPGMAFPDVGAQVTSFGSANGGEDYGSSSLWSSDILTAGINNGSFTQDRLDDMVARNVMVSTNEPIWELMSYSYSSYRDTITTIWTMASSQVLSTALLLEETCVPITAQLSERTVPILLRF